MNQKKNNSNLTITAKKRNNKRRNRVRRNNNQRQVNLTLPYQRNEKIAQQKNYDQRYPKPVLDWANSLQDPFNNIGVRQPSLFPMQTTTCRQHSIATVTANTLGNAAILLIPGGASGSTLLTFNGATLDFGVTWGTATAAASIPFGVATHPLYDASYRVVSAGIKAWLTSPYLSSSGQFMVARVNYAQFGGSATMYDQLGDNPSHRIYPAVKLASCIWLPLDIDSQTFRGASTVDSNQNVICICFTGSPSAIIQYEYTINYEAIPKLNVDAFNMQSSTGNPYQISTLIKKLDSLSLAGLDQISGESEGESMRQEPIQKTKYGVPSITKYLKEKRSFVSNVLGREPRIPDQSGIPRIRNAYIRGGITAALASAIGPMLSMGSMLAGCVFSNFSVKKQQ